MPNLNKVMLMGNLTRDPQMVEAKSSIVNMSMAINESWTDKASGERQERTSFVDLSAYGKTADNMNKFFRKGDPIYVEGRLKQDRWEDGEGNNRSKLSVIVDRFEFLKARSADGASSQAEPRQSKQTHQPEPEKYPDANW